MSPRAVRPGSRRLTFAVLLLLGGCGPILTDPTSPALVRADAAAASRAGYRLHPGDQIEIHHLVDTDYTAIVAVAPDGSVTAPGISGPVPATGLTEAELADTLRPLYARDAHLRSPDFSILLRQAGAQQIFVGGEVARPGFLDLPGGPRRLTQVLAAAGWLLPTARRSEVIVIRTGVDGQQIAFSADINAVESGRDLAQNVWVRPEDTVLVPKSDIASLDTWVDQYLRQSLPVETTGSVGYQFYHEASGPVGAVR